MAFAVNTDKGLNVVGGYVLSFSTYAQEEDLPKNKFDFDLTQYDFSNYKTGAYILRSSSLEFDITKYREILEEIEEEKKHEAPTWQETMESQVIYTAMMTDTLIDVEEE